MLQVCITGALGIPGSGRDRNYTRNCFVSKTYDFNVAVDRSFNLKVLVEVFIIFFFIHRYIYFFSGRRFHGFLYYIRRVWWNNHLFLRHWHLSDYFEGRGDLL